MGKWGEPGGLPRGFKRGLLEGSLGAGLGFVWLCWELNPEYVRLLLQQTEIHEGW